MNLIELSLEKSEQPNLSKLKVALMSYDKTLTIIVKTQENIHVVETTIDNESFEEVGLDVRDITDAQSFTMALQKILETTMDLYSLKKVFNLKQDNFWGLWEIDILLCFKAATTAAQLNPNKFQLFVDTWNNQLKERNENQNETN